MAAGVAEVSVQQVEPPDGATPEGLSLAGDAAQIELSAGEMPADGAELRIELDEPLADGQIAAFARWHEDEQEWIPVPTLLSDGRTVLTATVYEFSIWSVLSGAADAAAAWIGDLVGARTDQPQCDGELPSWAAELGVFDERNSPLRWCGGSDPADADVLVVKVANNRGYGMGVERAVQPAWSYSTMWDTTVSGSFAERLREVVAISDTRVAAGVIAFGDLLAPGEQMHYGFTREDVEGVNARPLLTVTRNPAQVLAGLTYSSLLSTLDATTRSANRALAAAATIVSVAGCAGDVAHLVDDSDWLGLSQTLLSCLSVAAGRLAPMAAAIVVQMNPATDPGAVGRGSGKVFGKIWQIWAAVQAFQLGWNLGEIGNDARFDESAFQASVIMHFKPTLDRLVLSPDSLGGLQLGADPSRWAANAEVLVWDPTRCEVFDDPEPGRWVANYPPTQSIWGTETSPFSVAARDGQVTRIDVHSPEIRTTTGVGVGSSLDELHAAYGDDLIPGENTGFSSTWLVRGDRGILVFEVPEPGNDDYWPAESVGKVFIARIIPLDGPDQGAPVAGTDDTAGGC